MQDNAAKIQILNFLNTPTRKLAYTCFWLHFKKKSIDRILLYFYHDCIAHFHDL